MRSPVGQQSVPEAVFLDPLRRDDEPHEPDAAQRERAREISFSDDIGSGGST